MHAAIYTACKSISLVANGGLHQLAIVTVERIAGDKMIRPSTLAWQTASTGVGHAVGQGGDKLVADAGPYTTSYCQQTGRLCQDGAAGGQ